MIGVFDSGVGGLSVLRELRRRMPDADFVYFGDTKHAPYGPRRHYELVELTVAAVRLLRREGVTCVVSACNSVSAAMALAETGTYPFLPERVIEMVDPTVDALTTMQGRILLVATEATIRSNIYQDAFALRGKRIDALAIPNLAGAIERGASDEEIKKIIATAFTHVPSDSFDTVLLGCTHYPLVIDAFKRVVPPSVHIFDPAAAVAAATAAQFSAEAAGSGSLRFLISKESPVFRQWVSALFPAELQAIEVVE